jgi:hypothetical protein
LVRAYKRMILEACMKKQLIRCFEPGEFDLTTSGEFRVLGEPRL